MCERRYFTLSDKRLYVDLDRLLEEGGGGGKGYSAPPPTKLLGPPPPHLFLRLWTNDGDRFILYLTTLENATNLVYLKLWFL